MHVSIPLGIVIGLVASFVQSLGITIQRKSHVLNEGLPLHSRKLEYRRPLWLLGLAIFVSSNILGSFIQIASLPVVILAPLGAVSLLWNAFFARLLLGDVFSPWMILGTLLIAGGAVLIGIFGIVPEPTRSVEDLLDLFTRPTFIAYFSLLGVTVVACLAVTHIVEFSFTRRIAAQSYRLHTPQRPRSPQPSQHPSVLSTNITDETLTERTPLLDPKVSGSSRSSVHTLSSDEGRSTKRTRILLAISYASFSGIISGMCLLFAKSGVELLLLTFQGKNQFWRWEAWLLLLALVVFALLQLWYLHKALILADPTLVCPSAFCFYNLSSIVNGLVYFDQFSLIPPLHLGIVVLGIIILLGGVWVVSIHSGGGGVDIVPWQEDQEDEGDLFAESASVGNLDIYEEIQGARTSTSYASPSPPRLSPLLPDSPRRGHRAYLSDITIPDGHLHAMRTAHSPTHDTATLLSPTSLTSKRRRSWRRDAFLGLSPGGAGMPGGTMGSGAGAAPTLALPGGGFQIGLSAVSPGFAVLPRERIRRRRATSGVSSGGEHDEEAQEVGGGSLDALRQSTRRTVSEGALERGDFSGPSSLDQEGEGVAARGGVEQEDTAADQEAGLSSRKRSGWKWVKRVLRR